MEKYVDIVKDQESKTLSVCFWIEKEKPIRIGEKMNAINEEAYMNGYNWEAFFNFFLPKHHPDVFVGMETDPEAGTYVAYYTWTTENEKKAEKLVEIIKTLIENEKRLYNFLKKEGENIEWD